MPTTKKALQVVAGKPLAGSASKLMKPIGYKASTVKIHAGRQEVSDTGLGDDIETWMKARTLLKPEDQLDLSDLDLREEIPRVLTITNPQVPDNIVEFSFKDRCFTPVPPSGQTVVLLEFEGASLHKESEEARTQILAEGGVLDPLDEQQQPYSEPEAVASIPEEEESSEPKVEGEEEEGVGEEGAPEGEGEEEKDDERKDSSTDVPVFTGPKKITNQFNYCERAALTYNNPFRDLDTQTIPPPRATFSGQIMQWTIYDAYQEDFENQQREKEKEKEKKEKSAPPSKKEESKKKNIKVPEVPGRMLLAVKTLERMINQNTFDEIAQDYRYWEDPSDEYREEEGTLLPLWKFIYEKTKKNNVTDVLWNPRYYDLFAVAFGCFDFMKPQPEGAVCVFTLKNPSFPEFICITESGVMCLDIHPNNSYLMVVGLYDGNVAVYNINLAAREPLYRSNSVKNKHAGIIWQVKWGIDMPDGELNFYSCSADGYVFNWVLMQNELAQTIVIPLALDTPPIAGPDGIMIQLTGCGTAFSFHPIEPLIFLVGTEEGYIYKCSTAYASMFLETYEAHHMPVQRIDYNKFYPDIFVSCSADWRVKVWEDNRSDPLFVFDLASSVGDVEWAPYSSTVFAAVTNDGKVHVFDLNINKYKAICVQAVVSKRRNKLTRLSFNQKLPIMIVGDDRGCITTLKLSPNLRKKVKPPKKGPPMEPRELEIIKLEKLLALVREPQTLTPPPDLPAPPS